MITASIKTKFILCAVLAVFLVTPLVACSAQTTDTPTISTSTVPPTTTPEPASPTPSPALTAQQLSAKYSFEEEINGWQPQTFDNSKACIQVTQSNDQAKDGQSSLKLDMDLVGTDAHKSQGEAWVDMRNFPPSGESLPLKSVDLTNQTVTVWVYAPAGTMGDNSRPNGFQIFVKDINWKSNYGSWVNVVEGNWVQLAFTVNASQVENGYMDQGFDPSQIIALGVKMGSGGGSTAEYQGPIYIDAVSW